MVRTVRLPLPQQIADALAEFGSGLRDLRRRRRIPMAYAADRAAISRSTLHKVERGDPGVGLGIYASVLAGYGMLDRLPDLVSARWDRAGLAAEGRRLPQRIRTQPGS
ncbi:MAG TPA: helix-turn-helix domain-containing protein [Gemmatimonadales bacterium]|jgi:transcriptional regulator with XRE-family HTH domain|nr:helix-turn-helix domain-containing protein [Gemmatimonadales bacterium]